MIRLFKSKKFTALFLTLFLAACGTNPVTGEREFQFISESQEVNIGKKQYSPSKQAQGGELTEYEELNEYVNSVGQRLAKHSHRPNLPYEFVVLDNKGINAWALPGGKIAINRGLLLKMQDEAELAAVLGHEITHATARHGAQSMERGLLIQAGLIGISLGVSLGGDLDPTLSKMVVGGAALGGRLIASQYGREAELESDRYGIEYMVKAGYDPEAAVRLQKIFVELSKGRKSNWIEGLFASHPPSQERVEANIKIAKEFQHLKPSSGWIVGRSRYQRMIEPLKDLEEADKKLEEADKKIKNNDVIYALKLIKEAERISPESAAPYALRAQAYQKQGRLSQAEREIKKAQTLKPNYYRFLEIEGDIALARGQKQTALKALSKANQLLPTAANSLSLASLYLDQGEEKKALSHFDVVKSLNVDKKNDKWNRLAKLDFKKNHSRYVQVKGKYNDNGTATIAVKNASPHHFKYVEIEISYSDFSSEKIRSYNLLQPRKTQEFSVNLYDSLSRRFKEITRFQVTDVQIQ